MKVGAAWFRSACLRRGSAGERPPNKGVAWPTARHSKGTGSGSGSGTGMRSEGEIPCEISRGITEAAHPARPRLVGEHKEKGIASLLTSGRILLWFRKVLLGSGKIPLSVLVTTHYRGSGLCCGLRLRVRPCATRTDTGHRTL